LNPYRALIAIVCFCFSFSLNAPSNAASRAPVRGSNGMVVSTEPRATEVGVDILRRGGNAVDAAVAVGFALAVTHPAAGNLGGGGFMLIRLGRSGEVVAVDYRETAPASASRNMYLDDSGNPLVDASMIGYRASGVPGTVAGLAGTLEKHGTMKLAEVITPAIRLAKEGVELSYFESESLKSNIKILDRFPEARRIFLRDGSYYAAGERFVQPDLARSMEAIAKDGARAFYEGAIAKRIADEMSAHGGSLTLEDLRTYRVSYRRPIQGTYRGYRIYSMPPPSSGGIVLLEVLNILEAYPLGQYGAGSSRTIHILTEAMKRAFADRAEFLGDLDFSPVPAAGLTSKRYAQERRLTIDPFIASPASAQGPGNPMPYEGEQTTHFSVIDSEGNAVSNTYTLNGSYGSGVAVPGTGILLNNEMDDFASKPGTPNSSGLIQGEANAIAPRKRPLSSMTPTILTKEGRLFMVLGSPGGPTIISTVTETIINVLDFGMTIQEAVDAPRIHHQWMPDKLTVERVGFPADVTEALRARGHVIDFTRAIGDCQAILVDPTSGSYLGAADPRLDGKAAGY